MGVSQDEGGVVVDEVEQLVSVDVDEMDTLSALGIQGEGGEVDTRAGVAAGEGRLRSLEHPTGFRIVVGILRDRVVQHGLETLLFHIDLEGMTETVVRPRWDAVAPERT